MTDFKNIYFIGIGGIGMSALARYFRLKGAIVSGYDRTPSALTDELISEGINIHFEENSLLIPKDIDLAVYTPAIPKDHKELAFLKERGIILKKRSEILGMISSDSVAIAVSGTHGKTTVSALIAHILKTADFDFTAFLGGISKNFQTNFIRNSSPSGQNLVVAEADEFDRSFLTLFPQFAVITSTDADHLDIYKDDNSLKDSFREFSSHIKAKGHLVIKQNISVIPNNKEGYSIHSYGIESGDYHTKNLRIDNGKYVFDICHKTSDFLKNIRLGLPGLFNVENAVAAAAISSQAGVSENHIREALETFEGVKRRFDYQIRKKNFVYIDDYAHHPEELKACINAVKQLYPGDKITGVFQPHLYSRTRDFAKDFAISLAMLDNLILLEIYPAREKAIPGIDSEMLLKMIPMESKMICSKENLVSELLRINPKILLTMGAGDIDRLVEPIKEAFMKVTE